MKYFELFNLCKYFIIQQGDTFMIVARGATRLSHKFRVLPLPFILPFLHILSLCVCVCVCLARRTFILLLLLLLLLSWAPLLSVLSSEQVKRKGEK